MTDILDILADFGFECEVDDHQIHYQNEAGEDVTATFDEDFKLHRLFNNTTGLATE